jgi:HEPN domain-containing protein
MKDETSAWLSYADENLDVAELSLAHDHLNACLHNAQQAVEKYLKALIIELDLPFRRTHVIYVLWQELTENGIQLELTDIYLGRNS